MGKATGKLSKAAVATSSDPRPWPVDMPAAMVQSKINKMIKSAEKAAEDASTRKDMMLSVFKSSTKKIKDFLGKMNNSTRDKLNAAKKHVGKAKKAEKKIDAGIAKAKMILENKFKSKGKMNGKR